MTATKKHTGGRAPLTAAEHAEITRLARDGLSRNEISRRTKRSYYAVDKVCKAEGITFDRSATKAAVAARQVDLKARRLSIQIRLLDAADEALDRFSGTYLVHAFVGGPEGGEFMSRNLDKPPAADARSFMQAATYAIKAQLEVDARDSDNGVDGAKSMLGALAAGIEAAARELEASGVTFAE